jgi:D-arabinose 1-dehydrogenase-like Zn-dependent alcohol dehydrogenase
VGSEAARRLKKGDRVVIPFTIYCGDCEQCRRGNFSLCQRSNRKKSLAEKVFGHSTGGLFGYTHLTGGYPGGQAEYLRVPFADTTHLKVPDGISDEKLLFLSDILPTGWQAAQQCDIEPGDTVAAGQRLRGGRALHFALQAVEKIGPAIRMLAFDQPALGAMIEDALHGIAVEADDPVDRTESIAITFADEDAVPLHRHALISF